MAAFIEKVGRFLSGFTGWLMVAMMMMLVIDLVARSLGYPLQLMAELSVFVMMIVIYLGFARCEHEREHVGLEIVTNLLSRTNRRRIAYLAQGLAVITVALLLYAIIADAKYAFDTNSAIEGVVDLPLWPTKFIMVVGMVVFLAQAIVNLFRMSDVADQPDDPPTAD